MSLYPPGDPDRYAGSDVDPPVSYARTATADANRGVKARVLARWCWDRGIGAGDVDGWPPGVRARAARAAGVNPPGDESPTWGIVAGLLERMAGWAAQHPGDARARQALVGERPGWTRVD